MRLALLALSICSAAFFSAVATSGTARGASPPEPYRFPVYPGNLPSSLRETAHMRLGSGATAWLPQFIERLRSNRPPGVALDTVALFGDAGREDGYLAVIWRGATISTPRIEFHKFFRTGTGERRLRYLRSLHDADIDLEPPTGQEIFAGEPVVAVVRMSSGGSAAFGHELRLIQMKRNTVDITPDWAGRIVDVVDLDGDGQFEVVSMDRRWAGYFDGRGAAGPHLPVVLARAESRFVPACRTHAAAYATWLAVATDYAQDQANPPDLRAEALATALLAHAQIGELDEAQRMHAGLEDLYRTSSVTPAVAAEKALRDYGDALVQAQRWSDVQCAASASDVRGGHFGVQARANSFRASGDTR